jgi:hypothetical protein
MRDVMLRLVMAAAGLALLMAPARRAEADILYAATGSAGVNGELVVLDSTTGALATDVGPLVDASGNHYGLTGLAFSPTTGVLYGSTNNFSPTAPAFLVTVDPLTALVTQVGAFTGTNATMADIAFDPTSGALYGLPSSTTNFFFLIDPATGAGTPLGNTGTTNMGGNGLAADQTGTVYGSRGGASGDLFTFDKTDGHATSVATLTGAPFPNAGITALAFDQAGTLFGVNTSQLGRTVSTHLITINRATGAITDLGASLNNLSAIAFTQPTITAAVPEPSTFASAGIAGLIGCGVAWRRRKRAA